MQTLVKVAVTAALICASQCLIGQDQTHASVRPSELEQFAVQPAARVLWANEAGRIVTRDAQIVLTAFAVENTMVSPHKMSGICIQVSDAAHTDQIYLTTAETATAKNALEKIVQGIPVFEVRSPKAPVRYFGADEFRQLPPLTHTLNAAYYIRPDSSGLSIAAFKAHEFRFPGHSPSELAQLLANALRELRAH